MGRTLGGEKAGTAWDWAGDGQTKEAGGREGANSARSSPAARRTAVQHVLRTLGLGAPFHTTRTNGGWLSHSQGRLAPASARLEHPLAAKSGSKRAKGQRAIKVLRRITT